LAAENKRGTLHAEIYDPKLYGHYTLVNMHSDIIQKLHKLLEGT